jgi:hypothetical protein
VAFAQRAWGFLWCEHRPLLRFLGRAMVLAYGLVTFNLCATVHL